MGTFIVALTEKTKILLVPYIFKGFVGDPKRNVTIPRMHLVIAQRKPQPKHAARYLVRNLFPREVLICSTANTKLPNSSGRQPLDPNIMAALRGM